MAFTSIEFMERVEVASIAYHEKYMTWIDRFTVNHRHGAPPRYDEVLSPEDFLEPKKPEIEIAFSEFRDLIMNGGAEVLGFQIFRGWNFEEREHLGRVFDVDVFVVRGSDGGS